MPFIEEEKFKLMQEDLDNAKLKREEAENELIKVQEEYSSFKKKNRLLPIIMGILLGPALGAAYYFYTNGGGSVSDAEIASIQKTEMHRVIDSVQRAQARANRNNGENDSEEEASTEETTQSTLNVAAVDNAVNNATKGETVYSVQVGVFSNKKYPLLSSKYTPGIVAPTDSYFKYSLGLFSTENEAKKLRNELRGVGFSDAFVASYVNGQRQKIHH